MIALIRRFRTPAALLTAACAAVAVWFSSPVRLHYGLAVCIAVCAAVAVCTFFAMRRSLDKADGRLWIFSAVCGALFSLALAVGTDIFIDYQFHLTVGNLLLACGKTLLWLPAMTGMIACCIELLPAARERLASGRLERSPLNPANGAKGAFFIIWAILLVCWLPAYLGYFPGIFGYDMHNQTHQAATHLYNTYQPLLHTLFYEGCRRLGSALFQRGTGGVAVYTAAQAVLLSACLAGVCTYLSKRLRAPFAVTLIAVAFYALLPFQAILAVSSTKDALFSGAFLLLLMQAIDLATDSEAFLHSYPRMALFAVTALAASLLRNNMIYALAFFAVVSVLFLKQSRVRATVLLVTVLALSVLGGKALSAVLHASSGPRSELLNVPIQQLATAYERDGDAMSDADKQAIYEYLPPELLAQYYPLLSDPVKLDAPIGDGLPALKGFLSVWASQLPAHLNSYTDSFLTMTLGYWYPNETLHAHIYDGYDEPDTEETLGYLYTGFMESIDPSVEKHSLWPAAERYYQWFAHENRHQSIPVLSTLTSPGVYCWLMLFVLTALLYMKKGRLALPLALTYGVWLTLLLGPCVLIRYAYPIMAAAPLLLGVLFNRTDANRLEKPAPSAAAAGDNRGMEMLRFAIAGGVGFVIDYGCMVLFVKAFGLHYLVATALAFLLSVVVNYLMCAYWVFKGANTKSRGVQVGFILTSLVGLGLNELIMLLFVDALHIHYAVAKLIAVVLVMIWNYVSKRKVLVKNPKVTEETK